MDVLLDEAKRKGLQLNGQLDPTAADVAVQVYLRDKALLERKHAERYLTRPRSFEHGKCGRTKTRSFTVRPRLMWTGRSPRRMDSVRAESE